MSMGHAVSRDVETEGLPPRPKPTEVVRTVVEPQQPQTMLELLRRQQEVYCHLHPCAAVSGSWRGTSAWPSLALAARGAPGRGGRWSEDGING